jgi:hypothetical protein
MARSTSRKSGNVWTRVRKQISDADLPALTPNGEVDGQISSQSLQQPGPPAAEAVPSEETAPQRTLKGTPSSSVPVLSASRSPAPDVACSQSSSVDGAAAASWAKQLGATKLYIIDDSSPLVSSAELERRVRIRATNPGKSRCGPSWGAEQRTE